MGVKSDQEVDRIVARERPGYTRVARARSKARTLPAADAGTPDLGALRSRAEALRLWDFGPRGRATPVAPVAAVAPRATRSPHGDRGGASPTHHIVTVTHDRAHEADPLQTRVVVVSRVKGKIIGEQG